MPAVNSQANSIGKPVSWNGLYQSIAEVQLCDIKSAKIDMKEGMCIERESSLCPRSVIIEAAFMC